MQDLLMAFNRVQKCMDLILCGKLLSENKTIDQDAVSATFRYIISEAPIPEGLNEKVNHYLEILREDLEVRRVFGYAARIKTMMMAKSGQTDQGFDYRMHLSAIGLPVENEQSDIISPDEFFALVNKFEHYAQPFRNIIASNTDTMARIYKNYEDISQLKGNAHSSSGSGCLLILIGIMATLLIIVILF